MPWNTVVLLWMPELKLGPTQHSRAGLSQLWEQSSGISAAQMRPLTSAEAQKPSAITAFLNNDLL